MPRTKRPFGVLIAGLGVIIAVLAFASPANAAGYSDQTTCSVSDQTPSEGSSFTLSGKGFKADEDVSNVLHSTPYTLTPAVSNASGAFSVTVTLPAGTTGVHTITSTGVSGRAATVTITIGTNSSLALSGTPATGSSSLAFTGAAVIAVGSLAVLLVVGGGLMMLAGRRRKTIA